MSNSLLVREMEIEGEPKVLVEDVGIWLEARNLLRIENWRFCGGDPGHNYDIFLWAQHSTSLHLMIS
jgi:hypothetical protein